MAERKGIPRIAVKVSSKSRISVVYEASRKKQVHTDQRNRSQSCFVLFFCKEKILNLLILRYVLSFCDKFYKCRGKFGNPLAMGTLKTKKMNNGSNY